MNSIKELLRTQWKLIAFVAIIAFILGLVLRPAPEANSHDHGSESQASSYTCSMHPQIRQPEPGKCPICAMDLIPVVEESGNEQIGERQLYLSNTAKKLANVQITPVVRKNVSNMVSLYGKIAVDETRSKSITAWAPGRIEKLFVNYTGAFVKKGDPLVELYSPELLVAQQEYLNALNSPASSLLNIEDIKRKFALWGITDDQLDEIKSRGTATELMTIYAPISGIVLNRAKNEGEYAKTGSLLYDIADLSSVWIYLDAYEKDIPRIAEGQKISFTAEAMPGQHFSGEVDFIEPVLDAKSRTVKVRAVAQNPNNDLKPGLLVTAKLEASSKSSSPLVIPSSAPLVTGKRAVVYVAVPGKEGVFEGREIILGERSGEYYVVGSGLNEGEMVVTNGAFKIDSEMQLLAKKSMMSPDGGSAPMQHNHGGQSMDSPQTASTDLEHDSHSAALQQVGAEKSQDPHAGHKLASKKSQISNSHDGMNETNAEMDRSAHSSEAVISANFVNSLDGIYLAYFDVQDALSHDRTDKLLKPAKAFLKNLKKVKAKELDSHAGHWDKLSTSMQLAAEKISSSSNIGIARSEFKKLSDALIQTAEMFGASEKVAAKQYHCPMAFNNAGADWLSNKNDVENPYFGDAMFSCGSQVKTFAETKGGEK